MSADGWELAEARHFAELYATVYDVDRRFAQPELLDHDWEAFHMFSQAAQAAFRHIVVAHLLDRPRTAAISSAREANTVFGRWFSH